MMKTSNKILIGTLGTLVLGVLVFLVSLRANIVPNPPQEWVEGNGELQTELRTTGDFFGLDARGPVEVEIKQGETSVNVEADENLMQYVETVVEGDILKIRLATPKNFRYKSENPFKVIVSNPKFEYLEVASSAKLKSEAPIEAEELALNCSSGSETFLEFQSQKANIILTTSAQLELKGVTKDFELSATSGSELDMDLEAESGTAKLNTSAIAKVSGSSNNFEINANSGSEFLGDNFITKEVVAAAATSATIKLHIEDKLDALASSGAEILYKGNPAVNKSEATEGMVAKVD